MPLLHAGGRACPCRRRAALFRMPALPARVPRRARRAGRGRPGAPLLRGRLFPGAGLGSARGLPGRHLPRGAGPDRGAGGARAAPRRGLRLRVSPARSARAGLGREGDRPLAGVDRVPALDDRGCGHSGVARGLQPGRTIRCRHDDQRARSPRRPLEGRGAGSRAPEARGGCSTSECPTARFTWPSSG